MVNKIKIGAKRQKQSRVERVRKKNQLKAR